MSQIVAVDFTPSVHFFKFKYFISVCPRICCWTNPSIWAAPSLSWNSSTNLGRTFLHPKKPRRNERIRTINRINLVCFLLFEIDEFIILKIISSFTSHFLKFHICCSTNLGCMLNSGMLYREMCRRRSN